MSNYNFNAKKAKNKLLNELKKYFDNNGDPLNAVVGCSGGKDSTVVLAALVEAIGPDRVHAVLMPNGMQKDISDSYKVCEFLHLKPHVCNIADAYNGIVKQLEIAGAKKTPQMEMNLPPVLRMATLKAYSQTINGRFTCNGNLSEKYIGWYTLGGDDQGAYKPLINLTVTEIIAIGKELGLPDWMLYKKPSDGLCGMTDEEKFGFSYVVLDKYIRTGEIDDMAIKEKIDHMHNINKFKAEPMPEFVYNVYQCI